MSDRTPEAREAAAQQHAELAAARGAERLLSDPVLREALDELTEMHTRIALFGPDFRTREDSRRQIVAIDALRSSLAAAIQHVLGRGAPGAERFE